MARKIKLTYYNQRVFILTMIKSEKKICKNPYICKIDLFPQNYENSELIKKKS